MFEGVRVTEPLCIKGLHPVFEGDKGDRRVTGRSVCDWSTYEMICMRYRTIHMRYGIISMRYGIISMRYWKK